MNVFGLNEVNEFSGVSFVRIVPLTSHHFAQTNVTKRMASVGRSSTSLRRHKKHWRTVWDMLVAGMEWCEME